jgi:hypothetical protein
LKIIPGAVDTARPSMLVTFHTPRRAARGDAGIPATPVVGQGTALGRAAMIAGIAGTVAAVAVAVGVADGVGATVGAAVTEALVAVGSPAGYVASRRGSHARNGRIPATSDAQDTREATNNRTVERTRAA